MKSLVLGVAFAFLAVVSTELRATPVDLPPEVAVPKPAESVVTCKRVVVTGSRLRQKVCMSKNQRDAQREADREALEKIQRSTRPPH